MSDGPTSLNADAAAVLAGELRAGRPVRLTLASGSMLPVLLPGDRLEVLPPGHDAPRPGELVVFMRAGELVVHRVGAIHENWVLTRGDNSDRADPPIAPAAVLGRVAAVERKGRMMPAAPAGVAHVDAALLQAGFGIDDALSGWINAFGCRRFADLAGREGLDGVIGAVVARDHPDLPEQCVCLFKDLRRAAVARQIVRESEFHAVRDALAGLPAIYLKGVCLALAVYPAAGLRAFSDIDVLVTPEQVVPALDRLAAMGYRPPAALSGVHLVSDYLNSVMLRRSAGGIPVHLHWHIFNSVRPDYVGVRIDMQYLWEQARVMPGSAPCLGLGPEHLLVHLAEHALRHSFDRLIRLRDIAEVVLRYGPEIDWDRLMRICADRALAARVYHGLHYVSRMTPVYIPEAVLAALCPRPCKAGHRLFRQLALRGRRLPEMSLMLPLFELRKCPRFLAAWLFPPPAVREAARAGSGSGNGIRRVFSRFSYGVRVVLVWTIGIGWLALSAKKRKGNSRG